MENWGERKSRQRLNYCILADACDGPGKNCEVNNFKNCRYKGNKMTDIVQCEGVKVCGKPNCEHAEQHEEGTCSSFCKSPCTHGDAIRVICKSVPKDEIRMMCKNAGVCGVKACTHNSKHRKFSECTVQCPIKNDGLPKCEIAMQPKNVWSSEDEVTNDIDKNRVRNYVINLRQKRIIVSEIAKLLVINFFDVREVMIKMAEEELLSINYEVDCPICKKVNEISKNADDVEKKIGTMYHCKKCDSGWLLNRTNVEMTFTRDA